MKCLPHLILPHNVGRMKEGIERSVAVERFERLEPFNYRFVTALVSCVHRSSAFSYSALVMPRSGYSRLKEYSFHATP